MLFIPSLFSWISISGPVEVPLGELLKLSGMPNVFPASWLLTKKISQLGSVESEILGMMSVSAPVVKNGLVLLSGQTMNTLSPEILIGAKRTG
jgi:hypothetical protein